MHVVDLIRKKRDGEVLTDAEIAYLVTGAATNSIPEYQLAAWLMAVVWRGLSPEELHSLTSHMRDSGRVLRFTSVPGVKVDKHSTGGVGDKTSFLVAPIVAAAGLSVPMISGRALGHTGGTLDKLESIPGYRTHLQEEEMLAVLKACSLTIVSQTEWLVPADRTLYSLRDRTGTVESPFLICASIMSKKLAAGLDALVLDVKTGSGAFLKKKSEAIHLAELMVATGNRAGTRTAALITNMSQPLGRMAGNAVEIVESVELLRNQRHPLTEDLRRLSLELAGWMLYLGGKAPSTEEGIQLAEDLLSSGLPLKKFGCMIAAQGGDLGWFDSPQWLHQPAYQHAVKSSSAGFLASVDCDQVGWAVQRSGAGRTAPGEPVSAHAGVETHKKVGDYVAAGDRLFTVYAEDERRLPPVVATLNGCFTLGAERPAPEPIVYQVISDALRG
ncbi:MAG: pyrimidine-nucleoside phosphorylase [Acidobacteriaceae bacterium]|nr:pyrimidine-nucleoside phosphorylase [Acidobacteriaceae bacterium]